MKIKFLGTGTSHGVPMLDCIIDGFARCPKKVCVKALANKDYARSRSSILVEVNEKNILVDVSADFREQALREGIRSIDAVVLTHSHADHIGGIPDIRSYTKERPMKIYGSSETLNSVALSFSYIFNPDTFVGGGIPSILLNPVDEAFNLFSALIIPIAVEHGNLQGCYGYRINQCVYIPDMKRLLPGEESKLEGIDTLILNCLREGNPHPSHMILSESIEFAKKVAPRQCFFTHMSHDIDFMEDTSKLPGWIQFAHDGMVIDI